MFEQFPVLLAPIEYVTTVKTQLQGTIQVSSGSKTVTGTGTKFIVELPSVGNQLFVTVSGVKTSIGYVARIINDTTLQLEEACPIAVSAGTPCIAHVYRPGYKMAPNGFLYPEGATPKTIVDFFRRVKVSERYITTIGALVPYTIEDGETPELVSQKFYDTPFYHWTILMANDITNPREEWPVTEKQLMSRIELLYPGSNYWDVYEYRNASTGYVEEHDPAAILSGEQIAISIYDYEFEKNEEKRNIKVIQPIFINEFIRNFYNELIT